MLDPQGNVATCNSTHFFIVRRGEVWTSTGDYCLGGITRRNIIRVCEENGVPVKQKNFSTTEVYGADEAFVTGTFAGLCPVREVDGRIIAHPVTGYKTAPSLPGPVTAKLTKLYQQHIARETTRP